MLIECDDRQDYGENRWIGMSLNDIVVVVFFTERGEGTIRIIQHAKRIRMSVRGTIKRLSKADWEQLAKTPDEEIDYSDIPPLPETFFKRARVWRPESKLKVTVEVDSDILEWFKAEDPDWQARMETALRLYVETHKAYRKKSAVPY